MSMQELALIKLPCPFTGDRHAGKTVGEVWEAEPNYVDGLAAMHHLEPGAKYEALGYYATRMIRKLSKTKTNTEKEELAKEQKGKELESEDMETSDKDEREETTTLVQQAASSMEAAPGQAAMLPSIITMLEMNETTNRMSPRWYEVGA